MPERWVDSLVSVIVCVYNGSAHLGATIETVLSQTHSDFELIVVDDGSTDRSVELVKSYADHRVRLLRQENRGTAGALASGFSAARGEFVAFLDQDDLWTCDKLAAHLDWMRRRPEIDLTFSWFKYIDSAGNDIGLHSIRYQGTIDFRGLLEEFVIGATSNVVVRHAALQRAGGVEESIPRLYDLDLCLRVARLTPHNIEALPRDLMFYRRHSAQITRDVSSIEKEWDLVLDRMRQLSRNDVEAVENRARSNLNRYLARLEYERHSYHQALKYVAKGFRSAPVLFLADRRNWLTSAACLSGAVLPRELHMKMERLAGLRRP
jgi:glycosyltransferase involved in cell wall biosynthesis